LWFEIKPKINTKKFVEALSLAIYNLDSSKAIQVKPLFTVDNIYREYCQKEELANLGGNYAHLTIFSSVRNYLKFVEDNVEIKKLLISNIFTKNMLSNISRKQLYLEKFYGF
jgi:hypothetical protein